VEINSFTLNIPGIEAVGRMTAECFEALGFTAEFVPAEDPAHGPHLFMRRAGPEDPTRPVVLVSHLDTVFTPEEEIGAGFRWQEEEGRIFGPGSVDNKGGTMMIWLVLRVMKDLLPELFEKTSWLVALNSAEEVTSGDFARRTEERCPAGARCVLVFEGGPLEEACFRVVTARKGRLCYRVTCHGRAAHAGSNHAEGVNAIIGLAEVLPRIAALNDPEHDLTVNLASVTGGTVLNRVPHHAAAELEMRAFQPTVLAEAVAAIEAMSGITPSGAEIVVERLGATAAWPGGGATLGLFQVWQKAGESLRLAVAGMERGGLSDANYLSHLGPTLDGMGPSGGNAHCSVRSADGLKLPEYVEPASFVPKAAMNVLALMELLRQPERHGLREE
jgi:glutamate carboxypeptidase